MPDSISCLKSFAGNFVTFKESEFCLIIICGDLDNDENPGEADCHKKGAAHSERPGGEGEAEESENFWKTLKMQPNQNLETLGENSDKNRIM